jgi:hypothetical protein
MLDLLIRAAAAAGNTTSAPDAIDQGLPNPKGQQLSQLSIIFAAISALFVASRCLTRILMHQFGWDDGFIIGALVLTAGMAATYNGGQLCLHHHRISRIWNVGRELKN